MTILLIAGCACLIAGAGFLAMLGLTCAAFSYFRPKGYRHGDPDIAFYEDSK